MGKQDTENTKNLEFYQSIKIPSGCNFIVRLDGNRFTKYTTKFEKPFDVKFNRYMEEVAKFLMTEIPNIEKAHFYSDEISLYFGDNSDWFDNRVEKIVSISSAMASAKWRDISGDLVWFDSRIILTPKKELRDVYEKDRCLDAFRNCINGYSYYSLRNAGETKRTATKKMLNLKSKEKQELLFTTFDINVDKLSKWQKRGTFLTWEEYTKIGYNPIKKTKEEAIRRRIISGH